MKSSGEVPVIIREGARDQTLQVRLFPSAAGFVGFEQGAGQGFATRVRLRAWATDPETGVPLRSLAPRPGVRIDVALRTEGAPVQLSRQSAALTQETSTAEVDLTLPPADQEATLIAEAPGEFQASPLLGRIAIRNPTPPLLSSVQTVILARDELREVVFSTRQPQALTISVENPSLALIAASRNEPPAASLSLPRGTSHRVWIHGLAGAGTTALKVEAAGTAAAEIPVGLQPLILSLYDIQVSQDTAWSFRIGLNTNGGLRPGVGPFRFTLRTADPSIATVNLDSVELSSERTAIDIQVAGRKQGETALIVEGPPDVIVTPSRVAITVHPSQSSAPSFTLGRNLQGMFRPGVGTQPDGAIVTITSSDPSKAVLSRSSSTPGSGSVTVAVAPGENSTQPIYVQALEEGTVYLEWTSGGETRRVGNFHITPTWFGCLGIGANEEARIPVGQTINLSCGPRLLPSAGNPIEQLSIRAGFGSFTANISSSDNSVFTVNRQSLSFPQEALYPSIQLTAVGVGAAVLNIEQPAGFGPPQERPLAVRVSRPALTANCENEPALGKDLQRTCSVSAAVGVPITARSLDPALLVISADPRTPGAGSATNVATSSAAPFTLQGLASSGTVEIVFSAPGYDDTRSAVALRPAEVSFNLASTPPVTLRKGNTLTVGLRIAAQFVSGPSQARAGSGLSVNLSAVPAGVVSIEPRFVFGTSGFYEIPIRGVEAGSALITLIGSDDLKVAGSPVAVTVIP